MTDTIENLAEKRRGYVIAAQKNNVTGLSDLLADLYPDKAHFVYELLQNAEDAQAQNVRFNLYEDRLEFHHDGERLFSITARPSAATKRVEEKGVASGN